MSKCLNCKKYEDCSTGSGCTWPCGAYVARDIDVLTNADHIRSMTDEELAGYMSEHCIEDFCCLVCGGDCKAMATLNKTSDMVCREIVANWLKQPWKEET